MESSIQNRAFNATLARIAHVGLVVEDIVDAVHGHVVGDEKEESPNDEREVHLVRGHHVAHGKRERGVHP